MRISSATLKKASLIFLHLSVSLVFVVSNCFFYRKRSQSAGPGKGIVVSSADKKCNPEDDKENESRATPSPHPRPNRKTASFLHAGRSSPMVTEDPKPTPCELRVAQYEKPLTKGHCPKKYRKKDPGSKDNEVLAKKRTEKKERSHILKEKITKLIESGLQLSEYQARKAFSVYLHCILQRLSDFDDGSNEQEGDKGPSHQQIELVLKFLQKAALSLREPYFLKAPSAKLSGKDRAAIVAKELNEFLGHYRRETECFTVFKEEQGMVPRHTFEEFVAFANDTDLEDVLTLQTKLYRCAHIFLGKCLPPVTGRKNSLLRTAYGISPDRNLRDKQCSMRMNARANPPIAPQFTLPSQPPNKCLDISTTKEAAEEKERMEKRRLSDTDKIVRMASTAVMEMN